MRTTSLFLFFSGALALGACGPSNNSGADANPADECDPGLDDDGDCIANSIEGCGQEFSDRDNDGMPDWFDADSDGDGIFDTVEVGDCGSPRDTDGDGQADFRDVDSDNDGVDDGFEDRNGDGQVGDCETKCSGDAACNAEENEVCSLPIDGWGEGTCVSPTCLKGESDPHNPDTDGDGVPDGGEGTFICNPQSEENPNGLKRIRYVDSKDTQFADANWKIALEVGALDGLPAITNATAQESLYTFDMTAPGVEVAGFLVSRGAINNTAADEAVWAFGQIENTMVVGSTELRVSGTNQKSLDGFDTVLGTRLRAQTGAASNVTQVRAEIIPALLNRDPIDVSLPPYPWTGAADSEFVVVFQTVYRQSANQTLFMGAVARLADYDDRTKATGFFADDMSNGTGLSVSGNGEAIECEQYFADQQASADIIWIIDESGSTSGERQNIVNNAAAFFQKAVDAGLDFRMGVSDMNDTGPGDKPGIFAARNEGSSTGDKWLLSSDLKTFETNINDPSGPDSGDGSAEHGLTQGRAAINRHLPRDGADPAKIRPDAKLVVIYVTDERPDEVEEAGILSNFNDPAPTMMQAQQLQTFMAPYINDFVMEDAIAHLISEPLPHGEACAGGEHAYGYYELVNALGGQMGSICLEDLGVILDAMIDSIIGDASPIRLSKVPISASIAVARDSEVVPRSRETGWDFRSSSNSIIFFNMPFDPANPSDIVVSYRRWADQVPID